jgi:tetratricopeptide (TPR) repeat protein/TolB-like protein
MASIIPGYEYDIFISYRQKDNKGDRWVSEFVEALKSELESTFKEEVSIYFDINPHDGLLETHEVSDSLREKLKCLVFIPVISRTYCDPKSFAWEHEFLAFIEQASNDQYGLKVKIPNGNIASRILPVRIHDLDTEDIKLCESALGSVLRGVEFIYKSAGVNRPLRSLEEKPLENLNKTIYRDQLNKVANAIREIVTGLSAGTNLPGKGEEESRMPWEKAGKEKKTLQEKPKGFLTGRVRSYVISVVIVFVLLGIYAYPKLFRRDTLEKLRTSGERISVAVMPFQNMNHDSTLNDLQSVVQDRLINNLANSEELVVKERVYITGLLKSRGLTNYASIASSVAGTISQQLDAEVFIYGSITHIGSLMRLNAQLIDSKTSDIIKPFRMEGPPEEIILLSDSLSALILNYLVLSKMGKGVSGDLKPYKTSSAEAYKYFLLAEKASQIESKIDLYSKAVAADSSFIPAIIFLSMRYEWQGRYEDAKKLCLKAYRIKDKAQPKDRIMAEAHYGELFGTPGDVIKALKQYLDYDDQLPVVYFFLGENYGVLMQYNKAITEYEKALDIYKKWQVKPMMAENYINLGDAYHKTGQYSKAEEIYKKAQKDFPDNPTLIYKQAVLALSQGDTVEANRFIEKYRFIGKGKSWTEAEIANTLAWIYEGAGKLDKAELYYRQSASLEPERTGWLQILAYFLIDKERNVNEGMGIAENYLKSRPNSYYLMHIKGWGLYKQGKYKEALEVLQKSWDLRREKAVYDHTAFLHLEAAKKAVAGMN